MTEENSTGNNLIWAVTMIIIVSIIAFAIYYISFMGGTKKHDVDIEVKVPSTSSQ